MSHAAFTTDAERIDALKSAGITTMVTLAHSVKSLGQDPDAPDLFTAWTRALANPLSNAAARTIFDLAMHRPIPPSNVVVGGPIGAANAVTGTPATPPEPARPPTTDDPETEPDEPGEKEEEKDEGGVTSVINMRPASGEYAKTHILNESFKLIAPQHTIAGKSPHSSVYEGKLAAPLNNMSVRAVCSTGVMGEPENAPLDVIFVLDCSDSTADNGAMAAQKTLLKELPLLVEKLLKASDGALHRIPRVQVLAYGGKGGCNKADPVCKWHTTDAIDLYDVIADRTKPLDSIAVNLKTMGLTNTTAALVEAIHRAKHINAPDAAGVKAPVHVLLCTDGHCNIGVTDPFDSAQALLKAMDGDTHICISAIACGADVKKPEYLNEITKPGVGNGVFTYAPGCGVEELNQCCNELIEPLCKSAGIFQVRVYDDEAKKGEVRDQNGVPYTGYNLGFLTRETLTSRCFPIHWQTRSFLAPGLAPNPYEATVAHVQLVSCVAPVQIVNVNTKRSPVAEFKLSFDAPSFVPPLAEQTPEEWTKAETAAAEVKKYEEHMKRKAEDGAFKGPDAVSKIKVEREEYIATSQAPAVLRSATAVQDEHLERAEANPKYCSLGASEDAAGMFIAGMCSQSAARA